MERAGTHSPDGRARFFLSELTQAPAPRPPGAGPGAPAGGGGPRPTRRTPRRAGLLLLAVVVLGAVALAGRPDDVPGGDLLEVRGSVTVLIADQDGGDEYVTALQRTNAVFAVGAPCDGTDVAERHDDLVPGSQALVRDGAGATVATGWLGKGAWVRGGCRMPLVVHDLPRADGYVVSVGGRAEQRYTRADVERPGFEISLTVRG